MKKQFSKFLRSSKGATAIEYGLIAAGIAVAIAVVVLALGSTVKNLFGNTLTALLGGG